MGMLQCWRREKIFSSEVLNLLEAETTIEAEWATNRGQNPKVRGSDRAEGSKRKASFIEQETESELGISKCADKMRRAPDSTQTSDHQSNEPSRAGEQEATRNCAWLPSHVKFIPGEDLPDPAAAQTLEHNFSRPKLCESSIPGVHMLNGVDGANHKPSWPAPRVPPPLSLPKGARRIGCT